MENIIAKIIYFAKIILIWWVLGVIFLLIGKEALAHQHVVVIHPPTVHRSIQEIIEAIVNALLWFGLVIVPLFVVVGGVYLMTSAGDPRRVALGKKIILYSLIGLALILLARGVIGMINIILGLR